ncbi:hypothetical protein LIS90_13805 [Flavobacterium psychrophilum]|uniref:hypothetical protein n=1 Tax=Flavobacterium psychrophilum TaxID=96345 RepID=UPI001D092DC6|nr:hypothetical protein [Flavobacterium psychrophilum]MCB6232322.1 hypothetical protein [Flavobacterium psychrophilum]
MNIKALLLRGRETIAEHRQIINYTSQSGVFVATKATEAIVNKALPGAGKEASKIVKDGVKVTREIIKNEVSNKTKDIITEQKK